MRCIPTLLAGLSLAFASACVPTTTPAKPKPPETATQPDTNDGPSAEGQRLNKFFQETFQRNVARSPLMQGFMGIKKDQDKWNDMSEARQKEDMELAKADLARLQAEFDYDKLDRQSQISYRLFEYQQQRAVDGYKWRYHNYPVNQMFGIQSLMPSFLINYHRVDNAVDAEAYVTRLNRVSAAFAQLREGLERREKVGVVPPAFVFPMVLRDARNVLTGAPFATTTIPTTSAKPDSKPASAAARKVAPSSPPVRPDSTILADYRRKVTALKDIDQARKEQLISAAAKALREVVGPAYRELIAFLEGQQRRATKDDGVWKLPDGGDYYNFALEGYTTTKLTADKIHETGLAEVARIHDEMRALMTRVKFQGDLQAFFKFMREDKQFYLANDGTGRAAYLSKVDGIIREIEGRLDEVFITKPKAALVVKPVEAFREESAGKAFYNAPSMDGKRPGTYYANLHNMGDMPTYQMAALAYHEAIPGHHMQIAIAQERLSLPMFRRMGGYSAYSEGWGLYAEYLPKEMGLYSDPYSDFGRLAMELWRACRLVVDTGIHRKKWTREKAIKYLSQNTPNPEGDVVKAIERYIVTPGQATAYKVGMLEILRLRALARGKLGERFDLREFHEVILGSGPVPLTILGELVEEWIEQKIGPRTTGSHS